MSGKRPPSGRPVAWLRGTVLAAVAVVVGWRLTVPLGLAAAALAALAGSLLADKLGRRAASGEGPELRRSALLGLAGLALWVGFQIARGFVSSETIGNLLGPVPALHVGEALLWASLVLPIVFALRFAAARSETMAVIEVVFVGGALAFAFAAHREGMVHRPLAVGDWAWSRGLDPLWIFLGVGLLGTFLLAGLLIRESRPERIKVHFGLLFLIALLLFLVVKQGGVPKPNPSGDLGLTGEPADGEGGEEREKRGQKGGAGNQMDELEFKDEYQNQGEEAPVAVVLLHDDYSPPPGAFYFRQTAFSQWNGRRLVAATRDDVDRDVGLRFPTAAIEVEGAPPVGDGRRALRTTIGLLTDHVRPFALDSPARLEPAHNPDALRFQRVYAVRSHVPILPYDSLLGLAAGSREWSEEVFEHYTEAPSDPRYAELAEKSVQVLDPRWKDDPLAQALAIKLYLDQNGIYSRKSKHADSPDPTADFLFGDLKGYCVHFAHAAVYLFRSRGIPARVAAGYAVPESERGSGSAILIQGKSAHAWPEIYLEGMGWVVVDIAPETSLDEADPSADSKLQQMLGEMLRQSPEEEKLRDQLRSRFDFVRWLGWLLLVAVVAGYAVKLYRAFAPRFAGSPRLYRVAYRAALDHLAEAGLSRRAGESREDFARRAAALSPSFPALTAQHLAQALGSRVVEPPETVLALLGAVRLELGRNVHFGRRLVSSFDPFSWWRAR